MRKILSLLLKTVVGILLLITLCILVAGFIDDARPSDVGIVFGSLILPDGTPSLRLEARLDKALDLYRAGMIAHIIVSGGQGANENANEADAMRNYLVPKGVPETAIFVDKTGNDTWATAVNSAALMKEHGYGSAIVITQYFHVLRSRIFLQAQHIGTIYSVHPAYFEWRDLYSLPREVIACVFYAPEFLK